MFSHTGVGLQKLTRVSKSFPAAFTVATERCKLLCHTCALKWLQVSTANVNNDRALHCHLLNDMLFSISSVTLARSAETHLYAGDTKVLSELLLDFSHWDSADLTVTSLLHHCEWEKLAILILQESLFKAMVVLQKHKAMSTETIGRSYQKWRWYLDLRYLGDILCLRVAESPGFEILIPSLKIITLRGSINIQ